MSPGDFLDTVLPFILESGGTTSCWYRNDAHNKRVQGHPNSQHRTGHAVDVSDLPTQEDRARLILRCKRAGLGVLDEGDHVHIQAFKTV